MLLFNISKSLYSLRNTIYNLFQQENKSDNNQSKQKRAKKKNNHKKKKAPPDESISDENEIKTEAATVHALDKV